MKILDLSVLHGTLLRSLDSVEFLNFVNAVPHPQISQSKNKQEFLEINSLGLELLLPVRVICIVQGRFVNRILFWELSGTVPIAILVPIVSDVESVHIVYRNLFSKFLDLSWVLS